MFQNGLMSPQGCYQCDLVIAHPHKLPFTPWLAEQNRVFLTCPLPLVLAGRQEGVRDLVSYIFLQHLPQANPCDLQKNVSFHLSVQLQQHPVTPGCALGKGSSQQGLPGAHHHLSQFQWECGAGKLKTISGQHPHFLLWVPQLLLFPVSFLPLPATQPVPCAPVPQCIPLSWAASCGQPLSIRSSCKSNTLPGLPIQQGLGEPGRQCGGTGCVPRSSSHTSAPGAFG